MRYSLMFLLLTLMTSLLLLGCPETATDDDDDATSDDDDTGDDDDTVDDDDSADDDDTVEDGDGDGWPADEDCDDTDAGLNLDDEDGDGWTTCDGDCNDDADDVHPDANEAWYDGEDSDCDGALDPDPCVEPPPEHEAAIDAGCIYTPTGNFAPDTEWQIESFVDFPDARDTVMTPMVGQLTDDNGDGVVDALDTPDIVIISRDANNTSYHGVLRILSGDGSAVHLSVQDVTFNNTSYYPHTQADVALGDIDGDGDPEIVTTVCDGASCYPGAFDLSGALEWVVTDYSVPCHQNGPALHDLDADGDVEVVVGMLILNGLDGAVQGVGEGGAGYSSEYVSAGYHSHGADLDGDGIMEVVAGSHIYEPQGTTLCTTGEADGLPSTADLDNDGYGEMVVSGNYSVRVFDHTCVMMAEWSINGGGRGGQATLADFDGDGNLEIGIAGATLYTVHEADGSVLWAQPITDASSNSTGSSVFDFDGDGAAEVVYADEYTLWVYDGSTGAVVYQDSYHSSGTIFEYPVIADVDNDGNAEIVVPNDSWYANAYGVQVIGDLNDEWVGARTVWNQKAYTITNVNDDLSIPTPTAPNWPTYNNFRQGAPGSFNPQGAPNLFPMLHGPCQEGTGEPVEVLVQVANGGVVTAPASVEIAVYGVDADDSRTLLESTALGSPLLSGVLSAPLSFTFAAADLEGYEHLVVVVDDLAASNECDEGDNEAEVDLTGIQI